MVPGGDRALSFPGLEVTVAPFWARTQGRSTASTPPICTGPATSARRGRQSTSTPRPRSRSSTWR